MIQVQKFGRRRPTLFNVNGRLCFLSDAAKSLGLTPKALQKRVERGTDLKKPPRPRNRGLWSQHGL